VNQTALCAERAVPTPALSLEVHRGDIPGHPGATTMSGLPKKDVFAQQLQAWSLPVPEAAGQEDNKNNDWNKPW
jgi:hypothetical protein